MGLKAFTGEEVRGRYLATALVDRASYGLQLPVAARMPGWLPRPSIEGVGGRLYVTNLRVAFVAHSVNRLQGTLSIPLTNVVDHHRRRRGLRVGFEVISRTNTHRFLTWGNAVGRDLDRALRDLGPDEYTALGHITATVEAAIASHPGPEGYLEAAHLFQRGTEPQAFDIASVVNHRTAV
ncbi:hypothetical protein ACIB24_08935 [Spongisporangium articulatum]|uniref:Uncharacterized protein n=1 Tax=Spongisporangium articulatum TaxID=3362603 RepID=A0ABW8ALE4_9ACTN